MRKKDSNKRGPNIQENTEYVLVWRVQVWAVKMKHLIEAELYETEEEAEVKVTEFRKHYPEDEGYAVIVEQDTLKITKNYPESMWPSGFIPFM